MLFEAWWLSRLEPLLQVKDAWLLMWLMGAVGATQVATGSLAVCVDADEAGASVMVFEVCRLSRLEPLLRGMTHWCEKQKAPQRGAFCYCVCPG